MAEADPSETKREQCVDCGELLAPEPYDNSRCPVCYLVNLERRIWSLETVQRAILRTVAEMQFGDKTAKTEASK